MPVWLHTAVARPTGTPIAPARVAIAAAVAGVGTAIIAGPLFGIAVAIVVVLALYFKLVRWALVVGGPACLFLAGAYIAQAQWRHHYPAVFEWPTLFRFVAGLGWLGIVLTVASALVDRTVRPAPPVPSTLDHAPPVIEPVPSESEAVPTS